jgi:chromosome segregation ATPase
MTPMKPYEPLSPPILEADISSELEDLFSQIMGEEGNNHQSEVQRVRGQLNELIQQRDSIQRQLDLHRDLVQQEKAEKLQLSNSKNILVLENESLKARISRAEQRCLHLQAELAGVQGQMELKNNKISEFQQTMKHFLSSNQSTLNILHQYL